MIRASRILVPVNGNPTDEEAVALACEVARRGKSAVYAIYVIEVKRTLPLDVDLPPEAAKGDTVLARAERLQGEQNCFITLCADEAPAQARDAERRITSGEPALAQAWAHSALIGFLRFLVKVQAESMT